MLDEILAPLFTTEWGHRLGWGGAISLLVLIAMVLLISIYNWRQDYLLTHRSVKSSNKILEGNDALQLIAQIPNFHLFGYRGVSDRSLPITSLQIHLVGVIKAEPEKFSRVIISEGGKSGKVYQVGDTLTGGVRINAITEDGVVLENEGRFEKLPLRRTPLEFQGMPKPLLPNSDSQEE